MLDSPRSRSEGDIPFGPIGQPPFTYDFPSLNSTPRKSRLSCWTDVSSPTSPESPFTPSTFSINSSPRSYRTHDSSIFSENSSPRSYRTRGSSISFSNPESDSGVLSGRVEQNHATKSEDQFHQNGQEFELSPFRSHTVVAEDPRSNGQYDPLDGFPSPPGSPLAALRDGASVVPFFDISLYSELGTDSQDRRSGHLHRRSFEFGNELESNTTGSRSDLSGLERHFQHLDFATKQSRFLSGTSSKNEASNEPLQPFFPRLRSESTRTDFDIWKEPAVNEVGSGLSDLGFLSRRRRVATFGGYEKQAEPSTWKVPRELGSAHHDVPHSYDHGERGFNAINSRQQAQHQRLPRSSPPLLPSFYFEHGLNSSLDLPPPSLQSTHPGLWTNGSGSPGFDPSTLAKQSGPYSTTLPAISSRNPYGESPFRFGPGPGPLASSSLSPWIVPTPKDLSQATMTSSELVNNGWSSLPPAPPAGRGLVHPVANSNGTLSLVPSPSSEMFFSSAMPQLSHSQPENNPAVFLGGFPSHQAPHGPQTTPVYGDPAFMHLLPAPIPLDHPYHSPSPHAQPGHRHQSSDQKRPPAELPERLLKQIESLHSGRRPRKEQINPNSIDVVTGKNHPSIVNTGNQGPMMMQPGDWVCGACGFTNWRRRRACLRCFPFFSNSHGLEIQANAKKAALLASGKVSSECDAANQ